MKHRRVDRVGSQVTIAGADHLHAGRHAEPIRAIAAFGDVPK